MLRRVLFVLLTPILAFAGDGEDGKLVDKYSGLEVTLPDGWKRRNDMESVNRPLVVDLASGLICSLCGGAGLFPRFDNIHLDTRVGEGFGNAF